jgi:hypothetical protein
MAQDSESELAPHPHSVRLWGTPGGLNFPPLCPNCGATATQRITYSKAFLRILDSETPNSYVVTSASVPFCDPCIAQHRAETPTSGIWITLLSSFGGGGDMIGAVVLGVAAAFTGYHAIAELLHLSLLNFAVLSVVTLVIGLFARAQYKFAWQVTEYLRVPPQTRVTLAFDFSDSTAAPFEAVKFLCTMRDAGFAAAFKQLNCESEFRPGSPEAVADQRAGQRKFRFWTIVIVAIAFYFLMKDLLK